MTEEYNYCHRCGHALSQKEIENKLRPYCPSCDFVVFVDPKVAAIVLVVVDGRLVLVKRAIEPALGRWGFPGGYVDRGEPVEDAAIREVKEETGLEVALSDFVGLYSRRDSPVVLAVYAAKVVGGRLDPGPESQDAALFAVDELPPLLYPHDYQMLEDWKALASKQD